MKQKTPNELTPCDLLVLAALPCFEKPLNFADLHEVLQGCVTIDIQLRNGMRIVKENDAIVWVEWDGRRVSEWGELDLRRE